MNSDIDNGCLAPRTKEHDLGVSQRKALNSTAPNSSIYLVAWRPLDSLALRARVSGYKRGQHRFVIGGRWHPSELVVSGNQLRIWVKGLGV